MTTTVARAVERRERAKTTANATATATATARESAPVLGQRAEERAASYLSRMGFVVVDKNVRSRRGEVDLVCFEEDTLCFVEVRARASLRHGNPAATVDFRKQRRISHAAATYLSRWSGEPPPCRFDVVEVVGTGHGAVSFRLLRAAFEAPS